MLAEKEVETILKRLEKIEHDLGYLKEHMVDMDMLLTPDELQEFEESMKDYRDGNVYKLNDLERD